jgi:hypothetical protein
MCPEDDLGAGLWLLSEILKTVRNSNCGIWSFGVSIIRKCTTLGHTDIHFSSGVGSPFPSLLASLPRCPGTIADLTRILSFVSRFADFTSIAKSALCEVDT